MKKGFSHILLVIISLISYSSPAQEKWTLNQCIEYAIKNNIDVQQNILNIKKSELTVSSSKFSRLPNLNANLREDLYFGRSPSISGIYTNYNKSATNIGISTDITVYSGLRIKNTIKRDELNLLADMEQLSKIKEDLSLSITALYLEVLSYKEQVKIAEQQLQYSDSLVLLNKLLFENGRSTENNYYSSKALRAKDDLARTESRNYLALALLKLSQALNLENPQGFDVEPPIDTLSFNPLSPINIYNYAVKNHPAIRVAELQLQSMEQQLKIDKSYLYPSISLSAGYNNSYYHSFSSGSSNLLFGQQMRHNGNETAGLNIRIPIFNRLTYKNQIAARKIDIQTQELNLLNAKQQLNKEINEAYYNAEIARKNYIAAEEAREAALIAFYYEKEKIMSGKSTIFDFSNAKNELLHSELTMITSKYEYIFRCKILNFYQGIPLY